MTTGRSPQAAVLSPLARGEPFDPARIKALWDQRSNHARTLFELGSSHIVQGRYEEAVEALEGSLALSPQNLGVQFELGRAWSSLGKLPEAELLFEGIIHQDPGNGSAYFQLGSVKYNLNRVQEAIEIWECAARLLDDPSDSLENLALACRRVGDLEREKHCWLRLRKFSPEHPVAAHMLSAHGQSALLERASDEYLRHLFDRFAQDFDRILEALSYNVPRALETLFAKIHELPSRSLNILDAGCGTGLCGQRLRPWARKLTGVDISAGMLAKARQRNIYDDLHQSELMKFLKEAQEKYDWIVAADVFCYFGNFVELVSAAARCLPPGGRLYFSVEKDLEMEGRGYRLQRHGRYCHSQVYVEAAAYFSKLQVETLSTETIRQESSQPVEGFCVVLRKN
jgi:predicted TPR repeat methyltransferase